MDKTPDIFAHEKDIYDAIYSARKRITDRTLVEFALDYGILISSQQERRKNSEFIASITHDYNGFTKLMDFLDRSAKTEKCTFLMFDGEVEDEVLDEVCNELKYERADINEELNLIKTNIGYVVEIKYTELDHSMTKLRQRVKKEAKIQIEKTRQGCRVRFPANDRAYTIANRIESLVNEKSSGRVTGDFLDVSLATSSQSLTNFFISIASEMPNFELEDVTSIQINFWGNISSDSDESDEFNEEEFLGVIRNVLLNGESINSTEEFKEFINKGYYVSKLKWVSLDRSEGPKIVFESQIHSLDGCEVVKYNVVGKHTEKGYANFTKTRKPINESERRKYFNCLESHVINMYNIHIKISDEN